MPWLLGIDEAGYGPNLGPFVMSAVACRIPDGTTDLWELLATTVRRGKGKRKRDDRILVDDSKVVYSNGKGLGGLERGVFSLLGLEPQTLNELAAHLCEADVHELTEEAWFTGTSSLPVDTEREELAPLRQRCADACTTAGVGGWQARSLVVCPPQFNALIERTGTKSAVLSYGFMRLVSDLVGSIDDDEAICVHIDKQGGRNTYASQIQQALPRGMVLVVEEGNERSVYRVVGLGREVTLTFLPRADGEWLCVALASMVSKYLRELFMGEFNRFWQQHVPKLKPTAGYPGDAPRFMEAIRPAAATLRIPEEAIWRAR